MQVDSPGATFEAQTSAAATMTAAWSRQQAELRLPSTRSILGGVSSEAEADQLVR
jgi:hypothetical protein